MSAPLCSARLVEEDRLVASQVERADSFMSRFLGLMGREELPEGEGLLITPCRSVHTFFMRFTIDCVFLAPDGEIVGVAPALKPWRMSRIYPRAQSVLELREGTLQACGAVLGQHLELQVPSALPTASTGG